MTFSITVSIMAVLALMQIVITIMVGLYRVKTNILFMHGDNHEMLLRFRAHANFIETVPMTVLVMAGAEYLGAPSWLLWAGGASLVAGRLTHYVSIRRGGMGLDRAIGMLLTFLAMGGFSIWCLLRLNGYFV